MSWFFFLYSVHQTSAHTYFIIFSALPCQQITLLVTKELQFSLQHVCYCPTG